MSLNHDLLALLACPKCKEALSLLEDESGLACETCACIYPIENEIPILLIERAIAVGE